MKFAGKFWILYALVLIALVPAARAGEVNFWPAYVEQTDSPFERPDHLGSLGPLFSITEAKDAKILSLRPLFTSFSYREDGSSSRHFLYPFVNFADHGMIRYRNVTPLLQYHRNDELDITFFQLFPVIFSQQSPRKEDSYFAVWPIGGVLKSKFGKDRSSFVAWPLYVRTEKDDETRTHFPYPFLRVLTGPKSKGFGIWPLFGQFEREDDYQHRWALWPFHYHYLDGLDQPVPYERFAVLPFYQSEQAAGLESRTFGWPFFGYTRETEPRTLYSENRYFWPLLVQGRGEKVYKNRWMPFYTHETAPGREKHWYLWPLLKTETETSPGLLKERTSLLYFIYRDQKQTFADTSARLTFLWPLFGYWNDGYGHTQFQALDPLGVFFSSNRKVKENWTPLFALYRYDKQDGNGRHSLLWDMLVWERDPGGLNALYAGPLFEWVRGSHWEFLKGLIGSDREGGKGRMRYFWRD